MVTVSRDSLTVVLRGARFAHIMKKGGPKEIGTTVRGTGLHGQYSMTGHVTLGVILSRLRSTSKLGKLRDRLNYSVPPAIFTFPQLCLDGFKWFHRRTPLKLAVFPPTLKIGTWLQSTYMCNGSQFSGEGRTA
jgi:hypothetical protein